MQKKIIKLPGLIDPHVHLRDPGATHKEDFYTGTKAALAGGITTVIDMPNNPIPTVNLKCLKQKEKLAAKKALCPLGFYLGANQKNWFEYKKVFDRVYGLKIYMDHTTGPLLIENLQILENHFKYWPRQKPILVHAEDATLAKAIGLALVYKKWLHVCHVSQESELQLIKLGRQQERAKITCEVAPHHLFLTQKDEKRLGPWAKMRPPLRTIKDQKSLWKALNQGFINWIATDHAPHTIKEKHSSSPPNGVPGLETMLPLLLTAVKQKRLSLKKLIQLTAINARKVLGIKASNDWIEIDSNQSWKIKNRALKTKVGWSPFAGWKVKGKLRKVFIKGKKVFENEEKS